ncbi:sigma-54 interaction domain-containing protein [Effusibacillus lacus]|uniref:HTH-type transcriptional regulatory protein TyrR n=1 Tax=Effusibacillus lacus TaxID=1348429 RepID=A0A292YDE6_9BACL|nr:sigma 54-interacting transcriptional regulator [Effusibacillus lacus]TCS69527.1 regulatory Fis family protein [Effusibacillus lacus]GAX90062.1 sigma-54-dependent Fis family transcriptional regulator [Effusibacillus lacus]
MDNQVIVKSSAMQTLFHQAKRIASFPSTVLIEGETGSGKEVVAELIHQQSPRSNMPFIKINCGAIPESLLESELFGYERGAFTGAKREGNPGLFELADKGTLLLDEIGELPFPLQAKLLRVLQEREIRRVGGSWSKPVDVRIIASTNQNLHKMVEQGRFREDLYYRLHVAYIFVPPLRKRREDILPLLEYYLEKICREFQIVRRFTSETLELLLNHSYPGNVRELRNLVEGLCVSTEGEWITPDVLPAYLHKQHEYPDSLQAQIDETERRVIQQALQKQGSVRKAAKMLQISHATLLRKMQKHGIGSESKQTT